MNFIFLIVITSLLPAVSVLCLRIFSRKRQSFLLFWGLSWIAYSCGLICLLVSMENLAPVSNVSLQLRKVIDMFNLLALLLGTYSFIHVKTPSYWYRFSLYLLLLAVMCMIYKTELLSFYLPISVYQLFLTGFICYNVVKKWNIPQTGKIVFCAVFLAWGLCKSIFPILEIFITVRSGLYILEFLLYNMVGLCVLSISISYKEEKAALESTLFKTLIEHSCDVIFYYRLTPYRAFEYVSPSIVARTGFSPSDFYNDPAFYLNLATGRRTEEVADVFEPKLHYKQTHVIEMSRANGETFWGEFNCSLIFGEDNNPVAIQGTLRDVTKGKSTEMENLNAMKSRNTLLSYISHELRSPITSLTGYLVAVRDGTLETDLDRKEAMEIITDKTMLLKKLIDDLDQLSKMETNQFTFDFMTCTATDAAELMIKRNKNDIESLGFEVETQCDSKHLKNYWIVIDMERINQVFSNLLENSVKYSIDEKQMSWKFEVDDKEENFVVSVTDKGIGIKDSNLPYIFEKFYRANADLSGERSVGGRGLGLSLCKEIIAAHQGDIYVETQYGNGTTFTFIIPILKEV